MLSCLKHRYFRFLILHLRLNPTVLSLVQCKFWTLKTWVWPLGFFTNLSMNWYIVTCDFAAAILNFIYPVNSRSILNSLTGLTAPKYMGLLLLFRRYLALFHTFYFIYKQFLFWCRHSISIYGSTLQALGLQFNVRSCFVSHAPKIVLIAQPVRKLRLEVVECLRPPPLPLKRNSQ